MHWPIWRVKVAERSMEPALRPGDWLLVRRTRRIRPGQIVLARHPERPEMLLVKRAARRVDGGWWLASDNPDAGAVDSRRFGAVPELLIEGRLLARYWRPRPLVPNGPGITPRRKRAAPPGARTGPGVTPRPKRTAPPGGGAVLGVLRPQWCTPLSGSSCSPDWRLTSRSISSRGSLVHIAQ